MNRAPVNDLLEQGKNALAALRYREQVALCRAAIASLHSALAKAEKGEHGPLETWLANYRPLLLESDWSEVSQPQSPIALKPTLQSLLRDGSLPSEGSEDETRWDETSGESGQNSCEAAEPDGGLPEESPWASMELAARMRDSLSMEGERSCYEAGSPMFAPPEPAPDSLQQQPDSSGLAFGELELGDSTSWGMDDTQIDEAETAQLEATLPTISSHWNWRELLEPPVWASIACHSVAIGILSLVVIRHMREPPVTSIVSATYEGEAVLTQTPMESIGPMAEQLSDLDAAAEVPASLPLEHISSSGLLGSQVGSLALEGMDGTGPMGGLAPGSLSQGISSDSLSRVVQASAVSTGGNQMVQGAEFFGVKATGNLFIYVVDCSPSMRRESAFEAAKVEIARSLQSMKPKQRYYIYFFAKEIERMESDPGVVEEGPLYATAENVKRTMDWLGRTRIQREGWPPNDVLSEAISLEPDGIFLLFDGDTRVDVAKHLSSVNRVSDILTPEAAKAPIHVVHFFAEQFAAPMKQIAFENRGTYRFIPRSARPAARSRL